ncbi:MAG: hypothetical protein JSS34_07745 [Proteobacteria bacterium]|nr:hypothetical protein [Pseudomonadota bacterium]
MNYMKFMKKVACSILVLASFLQNIEPVCAMQEEERRSAAVLPAAAAVAGRTYEDLSQEEKDYIFEFSKAVYSPFKESITQLMEEVVGAIQEAQPASTGQSSSVLMSPPYLNWINDKVGLVRSNLSFFKKMREKYKSKNGGQNIWEAAERGYTFFEQQLNEMAPKIPQLQKHVLEGDMFVVPLQEFETFCQVSLDLVRNVLLIHRGLLDFPKTSSGLRQFLIPDYRGSQSDVEAEEVYLDVWDRIGVELNKLNPTLIENKMVDVNPVLRAEVERKRAIAEAEAQRLREEEQRRADEAAALQRRAEEERRREIEAREEAARLAEIERLRIEEEAARRLAQAQEAQRREVERQLEEERARAAREAAAAALRAQQEERRSLLREEYNGICTTVDAIARTQRADGSEAYEGIMKFSQKKLGGGEVLLNRLRTLLPRVLELHGLRYENPLEHVVQYPSQACSHLQNEIVTFYETLNTGKHLDLTSPVIESFMNSAQSVPQFESYFAQNQHGGPGFSDLYYRFKRGQLNDAEIKEFSKRIVKFGFADEGHSSRLLHPLFLAKRVWDNKPHLRTQTNDILYNFFIMTTEQAGRCAAGATARTNLMLHQLCGLLIDAPVES